MRMCPNGGFRYRFRHRHSLRFRLRFRKKSTYLPICLNLHITH